MKRIVYLDYLRVFSVFAVMVLHTAAACFYSTDGINSDWQIMNFYDGIVRWGVPVFVMMSGALFLPRNIEIKTIYKKYIPRMIVAYFCWSMVYVLAEPVLALISGEKYSFSIPSAIGELLGGQVHMWFIPMIIGVYIFIPIIKPVAENDKIRRYFLLITFIFISILPLIKNIGQDFTSGIMHKAVNVFFTVVSNMNIAIKYIFYFVLGYELSVSEFTKKQKKIVIVLGISGFIATVLLNSLAAIKTNTATSNYFNNFYVNVLFEAVLVFVGFKAIKGQSDKINCFIKKLADCTFGAYFVHVLVLRLLGSFGLNALTFSPIISIPLLSVVVFVLSFAIALLLKKIPLVKDWIV